MDQQTINKTLKKFYEFDDDDLYANRNGKLSPKQAQMIQNRGQVIKKVGYALGGIFGAIALCVGSLFLFVLLLAVLLHNWSVSTAVIPLISTALGFMATAAIAGYILWLTRTKGQSRGVLRNISGAIQIRVVVLTSTSSRSHRSRKYNQYQMSIGESNELVLDDELVGIVKEGDAYSINFMDFQNGSEGLILSMECLAA